jgi:hypothetical protein
MSLLNIKIVNGEVKEVWDTPPPEGEAGWTTAIEVRPELIPHRQMYTTHHFDLTKDPVEIVWGVRDIAAEDRKGGMIGQAKYEYQQIANAELMKDVDGDGGDVTVVQAASAAYKAKVEAINACTTHEELDALM